MLQACNTRAWRVFITPLDAQPEEGFALGFATPGCVAWMREFGHGRAVLMDSTKGTNILKFSLTILFVMNQFGSFLPVAFMMHKYECAAAFKSFLDNYALFVTNSPRHKGWPGRIPDALAQSPHGAGWQAAALAWRADNSPQPHANVAGPAEAPLGDVTACCPGVLVADCSAVEAQAVRESMWGRGFQGAGLGIAMYLMALIWCSWHLDQAWKRKAEELEKNVEVRAALRSALKELRNVNCPVRGSPLVLQRCNTREP